MIQYKVKVKLFLGMCCSDVQLQVPFTLSHLPPSEITDPPIPLINFEPDKDTESDTDLDVHADLTTEYKEEEDNVEGAKAEIILTENELTLETVHDEE
ncbi:hypothetical protein Ciccas_001488 [Cichlidogyrus casuarinus]|uniref:Uncharacterized protein n=1 Tax=Cichlidogyrus casuarinus TaxID=1844966 RepID=A0ABD2QKD9_9PLAT